MRNEAASPANATNRHFLIWGILAAVFLAAYLPVMTSLVSAWMNSDDNSHGFLVVPIALYAAWRKRESIRRTPVAGSWSGLVVTVLSLALYIFAYVGEIATLASLSLIGFLCGSVIFLFGYNLFLELLFPIFVLVFMIPVPAQILASLTIPLQLLVTKAAVTLSSLANIPLYCEGNVIYHARGTFEVVQACSGLRSMTALLMLGSVFGYLTLHSNFLRALLISSAVPIAIMVNILRLFFLVAALHFFNFDLTRGVQHATLGIVLFIFALLLFFLTQKGLSKWDR